MLMGNVQRTNCARCIVRTSVRRGITWLQVQHAFNPVQTTSTTELKWIELNAHWNRIGANAHQVWSCSVCFSVHSVSSVKRPIVRLMQSRLIAPRAVSQQFYFSTGPLWCPRDVPWCLMFFNIVSWISCTCNVGHQHTLSVNVDRGCADVHGTLHLHGIHLIF